MPVRIHKDDGELPVPLVTTHLILDFNSFPDNQSNQETITKKQKNYSTYSSLEMNFSKAKERFCEKPLLFLTFLLSQNYQALPYQLRHSMGEVPQPVCVPFVLLTDCGFLPVIFLSQVPRSVALEGEMSSGARPITSWTYQQTEEKEIFRSGLAWQILWNE